MGGTNAKRLVGNYLAIHRLLEKKYAYHVNACWLVADAKASFMQS